MADLEFVDPVSGLALGAHAFGTVAAGTASATWASRLRYKYGLSGSGLFQNALVLEVSEDGGATWRTDNRDFTLAVTAVVNAPNDPLFLGAATSPRRTSRLDLPALRAGCAYDIAIVFSPTLRTGTATTTYSWRLGVAYNESSREIGYSPDTPTGVLLGFGESTVNEWVAAPALANGTDKVTLDGGQYVIAGSQTGTWGAQDITLDQNDGSAAALASGEEYIAVLSGSASFSVTTMKGPKALAGAGAMPAFPVGEIPIAVVRVPYGGVIVTSTLLAVTGRLLVAAGAGLTVTVQPGRAVVPGMLMVPATVQTVTLPDNTSGSLYLSEAGAPSLVSGVLLATWETSGGAVTVLTDARSFVEPLLRRVAVRDLDMNSYAILGLASPSVAVADVAANVGFVNARGLKGPYRVAETTDVATLSGEQTLDGVACVEGNVALLTGQTDPTEDGPWIVWTGAWERYYDCDSTDNCYPGIMAVVVEGTNRGLWCNTGPFTAQVWTLLVALP